MITKPVLEYRKEQPYAAIRTQVPILHPRVGAVRVEFTRVTPPLRGPKTNIRPLQKAAFVGWERQG